MHSYWWHCLTLTPTSATFVPTFAMIQIRVLDEDIIVAKGVTLICVRYASAQACDPLERVLKFIGIKMINGIEEL